MKSYIYAEMIGDDFDLIVFLSFCRTARCLVFVRNDRVVGDGIAEELSGLIFVQNGVAGMLNGFLGLEAVGIELGR